MSKKKIWLGIAISFFISTPCVASSLPGAEISTNILGIGVPVSLSADFKINPKMSMGCSLGLPIYHYKSYGIGRYDLRVLYLFSNENNLSIAGVIGAWGDTDILRPTPGSNYSPIGIEIGLALSYPFTPKLTGRLNIVGGLPLLGVQNVFGYFPPAGGIELGYKFSDTIEGTVGVTGQGDFIGLRIGF